MHALVRNLKLLENPVLLLPFCMSSTDWPQEVFYNSYVESFKLLQVISFFYQLIYGSLKNVLHQYSIM